MTAAELRAIYAEQIGLFGEAVTLRRLLPSTDISVRARVTGYKPDELGGGIQQGDRKIIILTEDVTFDGGLKVGDKIIVRGRTLNASVVDDNTRRVGGDLVAYEVAARG